MKQCKHCGKEIKRIITNGIEDFCSAEHRDFWYRAKVQKLMGELQFQFERGLSNAITDMKNLMRKMSYTWRRCDVCDVCGKEVPEGVKYCGNACKQKAYRQRKEGKVSLPTMNDWKEPPKYKTLGEEVDEDDNPLDHV